jgi:hypothetical protein
MIAHSRVSKGRLSHVASRITHLVLNIVEHRVPDGIFGVRRHSCPVLERIRYGGVIFFFHGVLPQCVQGVCGIDPEVARGFDQQMIAYRADFAFCSHPLATQAHTEGIDFGCRVFEREKTETWSCGKTHIRHGVHVQHDSGRDRTA